MNERFRHCISMTKMLNSENLLADSGLDPSTTAVTADRILYNYAMEQCQSAALDELFGNPGECFQVGRRKNSASNGVKRVPHTKYDEHFQCFFGNFRDTMEPTFCYMPCNIKHRTQKIKIH